MKTQFEIAGRGGHGWAASGRWIRRPHIVREGGAWAVYRNILECVLGAQPRFVVPHFKLLKEYAR